jgi:tetratricopeptide (TPR) repeat protein
MERLSTAREHLEAGRFDACAAVCRSVLDADPDDADALVLLGASLGALGRLDEAISHLEQAIRTRPDHSEARQELCRLLRTQGLSLAVQGLIEEAIDAFGQAVMADPADAAAYTDLSHVLAAEGRFDEALAATTDALRLLPDDIEINIDRALTLLKAGHLLEGWAANEWRHKRPGRGTPPVHLMLPKLRHLDDLAGRTIVILHEDRFGDTLQFLRYAQLLAEAGGRIVLRAPRELERLMRGQQGIAEVLTGDADLPPFDYQCPVCSLPYVFDTSIETIPIDGPYIRADAMLAAEWAARLPPGPRVGLVWAGEARSDEPAARALDQRRNLPFKMLLPLTVTPGLTFVSLQMGPARAQIAGAVHDPMGGVKDFADTAAIIANLDAVISVDTAVAHLAGAMGKPVFLLDRYDNGWRWLYGRGDSPWYPTLMIFRQTRIGDWLGPVTQAAQTLEEFFPEG